LANIKLVEKIKIYNFGIWGFVRFSTNIALKASEYWGISGISEKFS